MALVYQAASLADTVMLGHFSAQNLDGWELQTFKGQSDYRLQQFDGRYVLSARSNNSAQALYKKARVDLSKTPYLNWSWRVEQSLGDLDPRSKATDDYVARIYLLKRARLPWQVKALNYVWLDNPVLMQAKTHWFNPYSQDAIMIPVQASKQGQWHRLKVDVRKDFKRYFNLDISVIDGVAIMTDSDNSGRKTWALFGDVYFSHE